MLTDVWIGFGSNEGDRLTHFKFGLSRISEYGHISYISSVYETEPWGEQEQAAFLNAVCLFHTDIIDPQRLLSILKRIEKDAGRDQSYHSWQPRPLDLDILFWGNRKFRSEDLQIPHARISKRKFVLIPMSEIDTDWIDPDSGMTVGQLLSCCTDNCKVEKIGEINLAELIESGSE